MARRGCRGGGVVGGVRASKVWVALAVLAAEAVMLACLVGVRVWDWVGGVLMGQ